jgi:nucleoside-diphosphate-sugar epimerase
MENVYMYGRPDGHTLTEDGSHNAHTKKGQLRSRMSEELLAAQRAGRLRKLPPLLLRGLGLFTPTIHEILGMQYQFEEPFIVDNSKIAARLGISATPLAAAIAETLEAYKAAG